MLAEHSFVTTLDGADVITLVEQFLAELGFERTDSGAPKLHMKRGRGPSRPSRCVLNWEQSVGVDFDRGRVTVVASIIDFRHKVLPMQRALALALVTALQRILVEYVEPQAARQPIVDLEQRIGEDHRVRRRRRRIVTGLLLGIIAAAVVWIVYYAVSS